MELSAYKKSSYVAIQNFPTIKRVAMPQCGIFLEIRTYILKSKGIKIFIYPTFQGIAI
jgi:hypothetical protein